MHIPNSGQIKMKSLDFKNLKLVTKIQIAVLAIAAASTLIACVSLYTTFNVGSQKTKLNESYFIPKHEISELFSNFKSIQYAGMKFAISGFESQSQSNVNFIEER